VRLEVVVVAVDAAATAPAQVSVLVVLAAGDASWATRRGKRNFALTTWDTRPENTPAEKIDTR